MTEDQARAALAVFVAVGEVERWIAGQPWRAAPGGWVVPEPYQGMRFRVEPVAGGPVAGMVGAPAMQEFQTEAACRRAGESMDGLLGYEGWATERRFVRIRWICVPK